MLCHFKVTPRPETRDFLHECTNAGCQEGPYVSRMPRVFRECSAPSIKPGQIPEALGIFSKATRLATAVTRWVAAGSPTRSAEEVERIYREICTPCEFFAPKPRGAVCAFCGCYLKKKITMATERCPHPTGPKWGAEAAPAGDARYRSIS